MKRQVYWLMILVIGTALLLAACGGNGDEEPIADGEAPQTTNSNTDTAVSEPPPAPTIEPAPTDAPAPAAEPAAAQESIVADPAATEAPVPAPVEEETSTTENSGKISLSSVLQGLQLSDDDTPDTPDTLDITSYQYTLDISFTGSGEGVEFDQVISMDVAYSLDPRIASLTMSADGVEGAEDFGQVTMVQDGETVYMVVPEFGCITSSSSEMDLFGGDDPFGGTFTPDSMLADMNIDEADCNQPDEVINGIAVEHCVFDETFIQGEDDQLDQVEGHIYIAKDGGYPVRMTVEGVGSHDGFGAEGNSAEGTLFFEYNLISINEPLQATIPEACSDQSGDAAWPTLPDAYEVTSFAGFYSYKTGTPFTDAITFYDEEMAAAGWEKDEDASFSAAGSAFNIYNQDGETANIIMTEESEGVVTIAITSGME